MIEEIVAFVFIFGLAALAGFHVLNLNSIGGRGCFGFIVGGLIGGLGALLLIFLPTLFGPVDWDHAIGTFLLVPLGVVVGAVLGAVYGAMSVSSASNE